MASSATVAALKLFEKFPGKSDLVRTYVDASLSFTPEELTEFTTTFIRFDENKSGDLDIFELNQFYEKRGEHKTHYELQALIRSISEEFGSSVKCDGVTYAAYMSILLKDKKGQNKTEWGSFAVMAKQHDDTKKAGKICNVFEKINAESQSEELRVKHDIEMRRANRELKAEEAAKKAKKQAALERFKSSLASNKAA